MDAKKLFISKPAAIIVLFLVSLFVYLNALYNGFVADDSFLILNNDWIRDIKYIPDILFGTHKEFPNYYRPVTHLVFMAGYHVFGLKPWGFHFTNIIIHGGVSVLLFLVTDILFERERKTGSISTENLSSPIAVAFIAGLLFATHPVNTESVTWISGIPELSCAFFVLLSVLFYLKSDGVFGKSFILSTGFFFIATLCKETALVLPILFLVFDYSLKRHSILPLSLLFKRYLPFAFAAVVYLGLRTYAVGGFAPKDSHLLMSNYEFFLNIFPLLIQYLGKLLLPVDLSLYYIFRPVRSLFELRGLTSLILTLVLIAGLYFLRNRNRLAFIGILWIIIPLLPVFYIPALLPSVVAERYLYLSSMGFAIFLASVLNRVELGGILGRRAAGFIVCAVVVILTGSYSYATVKRNSVWKDDITIWGDATRKSPGSHIPYLYLGRAYYDRGRLDEAIKEYRSALNLKPEDALGHNNLGLAYYDKGLTDDAIEEFLLALSLDPGIEMAHINLGNAFVRKGRFEKAVMEYREAIRTQPDHAGGYMNLGNVFYILGHTEDAIEKYRAALRLDPGIIDARFNLGIAYKKKGLEKDAIREFEKVLEVDPGHQRARKMLGR